MERYHTLEHCSSWLNALVMEKVISAQLHYARIKINFFYQFPISEKFSYILGAICYQHIGIKKDQTELATRL